jgi:serine/threonine protein kinase
MSVLTDCARVKELGIKKKMAGGKFGSVHRIESSNGSVVKVQKDTATFRAEADALFSLQNTNLVPKVEEIFVCNGTGYIVLEKLEKLKKTKTATKEVETILQELEGLGWLHVDSHIGNFMKNKLGKIVAIDFGSAVRIREGVYPDHPLGSSSPGMYDTKTLTAVDLQTVQNYVYGLDFLDHRTKLFKQYDKAMDDFLTELDTRDPQQ